MQIMERPRSRPTAAQALRVWREYKETGDLRKRDRLIFMFAPMVRYLVYRKIREIPAQCEVDDFLSCGMEALITSIDRYDPAKGATLEQFAWTRIQGAILDELRRHDWAPRSLRATERQINAARQKFAAREERPPTKAELAAELGITPEELSQRLDDLARAEVTSLHQAVHADEEDGEIERIETVQSDDPLADPLACAERKDLRERFRKAFRALSPRERQVAVLLYHEEWTLREIGARLGVSESRVCQIHSELRRRLREQLA
jgi:RNA polymerase sigma factor for flagellar operon FliA